MAKRLSSRSWTCEGYLGERVRAGPFDAVGLSVGVLFGEDAED